MADIITFISITMIIAMFVAVLYAVDGCTPSVTDVMVLWPIDGGGGAVFFSLIISIMLRRLIIYSGFTTPCSPLHIWKPRGHVVARDHLPGGGPPAFLLWLTSHAVYLCWTEPGLKKHLRFMYCVWKWSKFEFCFETLQGSKFYAAGLILCDERIVVCNWVDSCLLMGSAVRWFETCFFSWPSCVWENLSKKKS